MSGSGCESGRWPLHEKWPVLIADRPLVLSGADDQLLRPTTSAMWSLQTAAKFSH